MPCRHGCISTGELDRIGPTIIDALSNVQEVLVPLLMHEPVENSWNMANSLKKACKFQANSGLSLVVSVCK